MKVLIGIPTGGTVKAKTLFCVVEMLKRADFEYDLIVKESCVVHWNREYIAKYAVQMGYTHILYIDSDMYFQPDTAKRLIKWDKDIIGVQSNIRQDPPTTTVKTEVEGEIIEERYPNGLLKCAAVGTGFMLVKTKVFKNITHPWFFWESNDQGEVRMGEDVWFCRKAREAGYEIFCDTTVKMGHIGDKIY